MSSKRRAGEVDKAYWLERSLTAIVIGRPESNSVTYSTLLEMKSNGSHYFALSVQGQANSRRLSRKSLWRGTAGRHEFMLWYERHKRRIPISGGVNAQSGACSYMGQLVQFQRAAKTILCSFIVAEPLCSILVSSARGWDKSPTLWSWRKRSFGKLIAASHMWYSLVVHSLQEPS